MSAVLTLDPGPLARFEDVKRDEVAPGEIFRRLTEGETLREIAVAWKLPRGRFTQWFMETHAVLFDAAAKVRADELVNEALAVAEEQSEVVKKDGTTFDPDVPRDKLRVDTRLRVAEKWDRARYGVKDVGPAGGITVIVDRTCGGSVTLALKDAGGNQAAVRINSAEALAIPATISQEI